MRGELEWRRHWALWQGNNLSALTTHARVEGLSLCCSPELQGQVLPILQSPILAPAGRLSWPVTLAGGRLWKTLHRAQLHMRLWRWQATWWGQCEPPANATRGAGWVRTQHEGVVKARMAPRRLRPTVASLRRSRSRDPGSLGRAAQPGLYFHFCRTKARV